MYSCVNLHDQLCCVGFFQNGELEGMCKESFLSAIPAYRMYFMFRIILNVRMFVAIALLFCRRMCRES